MSGMIQCAVPVGPRISCKSTKLTSQCTHDYWSTIMIKAEDPFFAMHKMQAYILRRTIEAHYR